MQSAPQLTHCDNEDWLGLESNKDTKPCKIRKITRVTKLVKLMGCVVAANPKKTV